MSQYYYLAFYALLVVAGIACFVFKLPMEIGVSLIAYVLGHASGVVAPTPTQGGTSIVAPTTTVPTPVSTQVPKQGGYSV